MLQSGDNGKERERDILQGGVWDSRPTTCSAKKKKKYCYEIQSIENRMTNLAASSKEELWPKNGCFTSDNYESKEIIY
jgi:hypothetical protein